MHGDGGGRSSFDYIVMISESMKTSELKDKERSGLFSRK